MEKDILPPKKLIGNKCEAFVEKRRLSLEVYLNAVYNYLKKAMPRELAVFLDLHVYDISFLLQSMALEFFTEGCTLLQNSKSYKFNPIQVSDVSPSVPEPKDKTKTKPACLSFSVVRHRGKIETALSYHGGGRQEVRL